MTRILCAILCWASILISAHSSPPYPQSPMFTGIKWHWETYTSAAPGSDLWPITWGSDGNLYTAWGDGGGFGGTDHDGRVAMGFARIEGIPPHWRAININGGVHPLHSATFPLKGKTAGLIFDHGTLYALVNLQDGKWPHVNTTIYTSADNGKTWQNTASPFPPNLNSFHPAIFLNFGPDNTLVPAPLQPYIYIYGPKHLPDPAAQPTAIYLARATPAQLTQPAAYQYLATAPPRPPTWTTDISRATPVFADPATLSIASVTSQPRLHRYLLTAYHTGPGQLGIFDAPQPWGPWTTIAYYEHFGQMGADGEGLLCTFPPKWTSPDGRTLWAIFSAYGGSAKQGIHAHDKFNLIQATLQTNPAKQPQPPIAKTSSVPPSQH